MNQLHIMKKLLKPLILGATILLFATECSKDAQKPSVIDPTKNPDLLGKVLVIDNATNTSGTAPAPTTTTGTPAITNKLQLL